MLIGLMLWVFNATLNNISVISWRSVLLVEKTGVPRENHRPAIPLINLNMLHTDTRTTGTKRILGADWRDRDRNVAG